MSTNNTFQIYLSVSIRKGANDRRGVHDFWDDKSSQFLVHSVSEVKIKLIEPFKSPHPRWDYQANYHFCVEAIKRSDLVLVDARTPKGIGVGAELMLAKQIGVPVLALCPPNSHYRRTLFDENSKKAKEWIHPFISELSSKVVASLEECGEHIRALSQEAVSGAEELLERAC